MIQNIEFIFKHEKGRVKWSRKTNRRRRVKKKEKRASFMGREKHG